MDAIDNPSYFALSSEAQNKFCQLLSLRRWSDQGKMCATLPGDVGLGLSGRRVSATWQSRRNFKSLQRTNSEDTHLLVLGKPRPTDLPPLVYTSHHQRHGSAGNVTSTSDDLRHQDMVHCTAGNKDDGHVFLGPADYYNGAILAKNRIPPSGKRRHSIGSFLNRDPPFAASLPNESIAKEIFTRAKFKKINLDKVGSKMAQVQDEPDILLLSCGESEVAAMWVEYLISCFQSISVERRKPPFKLQNTKLEDLSYLLAGVNTSIKRPTARLQIVIICPLFVEKIRIAALQDYCFSKILHPDKVLAMMLGVQDDDDNNHMKTVFPHYELWRKMNVKDQDPTSVGDFLGVSMDILSRTWQMQEIINAKEQTYFSILPKKVKVGQDKVIVMLGEPLAADDDVKVFVDKSGQHSEVTVVKRNPYTLQFTMPGHCLHVSMLVNVHVEKNGKSLGKRMVKCESRMRELEQLLRLLDNPVSFLCQSFGLNSCDKDQIDSFLSGTFLKNVPPDFNLLNPRVPINKGCSCNEEFPTLLHFAAKYGLEKFACLLLEIPGGEQACHMRNSYHQTPTEIAERANHARLANTLKGHMQMSELAGMYNYLKGMTTENLRRFTENNYLLPRPVSDTYLIPPAARPVDPLSGPVSSPTNAELPSYLPAYENFKPGCVNSACSSVTSPVTPSSSSSFPPPVGLENYQVPKSCRPCTPHTPSTPHSPLERKFEGYLDMHSAGNDSCNFGSSSSFGTSSDLPESYACYDRNDPYKNTFGLSESQPSSKCGSVSQLCSKEKLTPDDELLEIINDFKNNVFTIKEVEKLVEEWQNRSDVQQSFKEKQEQLNKMREEYDRIQHKMKDEMKRPTPFERFRKFFSRGKHKHCDSSERSSVGSDISTSQMRAISSISLHSASSTSSGINSISSGNGPSLETASNKMCLSSPTECAEIPRRNNVYAEMPQPPRFVDLGASPADFSEYVQPDCATSKSKNPNRASCCGGSVFAATIHECAESEPSDRSSTSSHGVKSPLKFYSFGRKDGKRAEKGRPKTNSLRVESKNKRKHVKSKIKSAENLIYDGESSSDAVAVGAARLSHRMSDEKNRQLSSCEMLCSETIKCLHDLEKAAVTATATVTGAGEQIRFEFDRAPDDSPAPSECAGSPANSSLHLSSLSLNSNCTIDENGDIKDERCSLELNISERGDAETETVPPLSVDSQRTYLALCNLPDYANVNVNVKSAQTALPRGCKYATVSS